MTKEWDEQRLVEPLIGEEQSLQFVAVEPLLIAARMTKHPVDCAVAFRIWPPLARPVSRPWRMIAKAVHGYGIPILALDDRSTSEEIGCHLVLLAYWHRYLSRDEPGLVEALASAYPEAVDRIKRGVNTPDRTAAGSMLLEGLLHPGFDPAKGAESIRRYINRKARVAVLEHRKIDAVASRPWLEFGITERYYYKLLKRFGNKIGGRYEIDDDARERIRTYLQDRERATTVRSSAIELLQQRGFSWEAARKWLQRHPIAEVASARPRSSRSSAAT